MGRPPIKRQEVNHRAILKFLKANGKSIEWLAEQLDVSDKSIQNWGNLGWPVAEYSDLCAVVGHELFSKEGSC